MRMLLLAAAMTLAAAPAFATVYKTKFTGADGSVIVVTFNDADKTSVTDKGDAGTYTYDEASKKLCATDASGQHCVTFANALVKAGDTSAYTMDDGATGTAVLESAQ